MLKNSFFVFLMYLPYGVPLYAKVVITSPLDTYYKEAQAILNKYERPITVLEIGTATSRYTLPIAAYSQGNAKCIALFEGNATSLVEIAEQQKLKNAVILNPQELLLTDIETLGRCEHFDVTLVHSVGSLLEKDFSRALTAFSNLGDILFIEIPKGINQDTLPTHFQLRASTKTDQLFFSHQPKTTLDVARFNEATTLPGKNPPYTIKSDFQGKWLYKHHSTSAWVPGINLVTFVMLQGIYPNMKTIISQLEGMKHSIVSHNDLLIGNMVIQGTSIMPIDFNSKSGNRKNMMHVCLNVAIKCFQDTSRFTNPRAWLDKYIATIKKQVRRYKRKKHKLNLHVLPLNQP